jgi:hypothetical protein
LTNIPIGKIDLIDLLFNSYLNYHRDIQNLFNLIELIEVFLGLQNTCYIESISKIQDLNDENTSQLINTYNTDNNKSDGNILIVFFQHFLTMCENSSNFPNALLLSWIVRSFISRVFFSFIQKILMKKVYKTYA